MIEQIIFHLSFPVSIVAFLFSLRHYKSFSFLAIFTLGIMCITQLTWWFFDKAYGDMLYDLSFIMFAFYIIYRKFRVQKTMCHVEDCPNMKQ